MDRTAQAKELLNHSGIGVHGSGNTYILLDRHTDGQNGRRVYIAGKKLINRMLALPPEEAEEVMRNLTSLRGWAGSINSFTSQNKPNRHISVIGNTTVEYEVFQSQVGDIGPGVYIKDFVPGGFGNNKPALYKVAKRKNEWSINTQPTKQITTNFAAINGEFRNIQRLATELIPDLLENAYDRHKYEGCVTRDAYTLLYNPPPVFLDGETWTTPEQKQTNSMIKANLMAQALSGAKQTVQWVIHGDGVKILDDALNQLKGRNLSNHTILIVSPTQAVHNTFDKMKDCQMKVHSSLLKFHSDDVIANKALLGTGAEIEKSLMAFPDANNDSDYALDVELLAKSIKGVKYDVTAKVGGGTKGAIYLGSTLPAIATAAFTGGAGALVALALEGVSIGLTAYNQYKLAQKMMGFAQTAAKDPNLSPHWRPYDSSEKLRARAVKTFRDMLNKRGG